MKKALSLLLTGIVLAGCSAPESSLTSGPDKIILAYMTIPDNAAAFLAIERKFFAQERLEVETREIRGTAEALPKLVGGTWQFALVNYVSLFQAEEEQPGALDLVSDAYAALPNTFLMMVGKNSPIKSLKDLKWSGSGRKKKIGVATPNSVATLTTEITLNREGISKNDIDYAFVKLPDMPQMTEKGGERGGIDVGWHTEPFITVGQKKGFTTLADACSGPSDNFPIAGYAVSTNWVNSDPRQVQHRADIVTRFQRALNRAQQIVKNDRTAVTQILPTYTKIDAASAATIALGSFPTTMEPKRYQRVADQMLKFGYFKRGEPINAEDVIYRPPGNDPSLNTPSPSGATP
ncbi:ABC transporter substrate-binding protein [Nonomuraea sp. NPDC046802]|uniref:ABC transporter substrate-binding protein n=1 Tax=Nonomuraea sp. NPDC046802 TaxID=3154919 RepID=UPI0033EC2EB3